MSKGDELPGATATQNMMLQNGFVQKESLNERTNCDSATIDSEVVEASFNTVEKSCNCKPTVTVKRIVLVAICTLVALGFCVPIIIYVVDTDHHGSKTSTVPLKFISNCTDDMSQRRNLSALYNNFCDNYNGLCTSYLSNPVEHSSSLYTQALNGVTEDDVSMFINTVKDFTDTSFISEQCAEMVLPFLCQYLHPPCDGNGSVNLISREQCSNIRDVVCAGEWKLVMATSSSSLLPVCEHFNDVGNITDDNTTPQPLQCHYQFKEYCGLCRPLCGKFSQFKADAKLSQRAIIIFAAVIGIIGGFLVFVAAIIRREALLDFPSVLVIYYNLCAVIIGFLYHWLLVLLGMLWLLHLIHLFVKIICPIWSRKYNDKKTKIIFHVGEVTGAVLLSILSPVIFISVSEYKIARFPPVLCLPSKDVAFFTSCVPLCIIVGIGSILAIIIFWTLHKRHQLFEKQSSKNCCFINFSIPEVKIFIFSCYFIVFGILALITLSVVIRDTDTVTEKVLNYIICQAKGHTGVDSCATEREELDSNTHSDLTSATYVLLGLIPWSNLLFAVQVADLKRALYKVVTVYQHRYSQERTSTISNNITS